MMHQSGKFGSLVMTDRHPNPGNRTGLGNSSNSTQDVHEIGLGTQPKIVMKPSVGVGSGVEIREVRAGEHPQPIMHPSSGIGSGVMSGHDSNLGSGIGSGISPSCPQGATTAHGVNNVDLFSNTMTPTGVNALSADPHLHGNDDVMTGGAPYRPYDN